MDYHWLTNPKAWIYGSLCLVLLLLIACGTAQEGPAETTPSDTASQSVSEVAGLSQGKAPAPVAQREPAAEQKAEPAPTAIPAAVSDQPAANVRSVTRLQYAIGAVANESNRTWAGSRQAYVLFDPILEQATALTARPASTSPNWPLAGRPMTT